MITEKHLAAALSYADYLQLIETLVSKNATSGSQQTETYIQYTKLNLQRLTRVHKTTVLNDVLEKMLNSLAKDYIWVVLTESWCGDAAQSLPVLHMIEQHCKHIKLKLLLRDEHLDVMDKYLTNGSRSIPKLICLEKGSLKHVFVWGPRPTEAQKLAQSLLAKGVDNETKGLEIQKWYNADKGQSIQREIELLLESNCH